MFQRSVLIAKRPTVYFFAFWISIRKHKAADVVVDLVDRKYEGKMNNLVVANGQFFGGGMKVAPKADPHDGLFDVVAMCDLTRAQGIALAHRIYKGSHLGQRGIELCRGRVVEAAPLRRHDEVLIDLDGETPGKLPLTARIVPGALRIRA